MPGQTRGPRKAAKPAAQAADVSVPDTEVKAQSTIDADARIRELEERLAKLAEAAEARIRELEEKAKVAQAYAPVDKYEDKEGDVILIHFLEDGHTVQGRVWYRGQEVEVTVGDDVWNDSLDRNGNSWLSMTEADQMEYYGQVKFRRGAWPGKKSYTAGEFSDPSKAPPESELERADRLERERRRSAPRLPDSAEE